MDYAPNPITFGETPPGGVTLTVTDAPGGYAGWVLLGLSGTPATVKRGSSAVLYPYTLKTGDTLLLQRGGGQGLSVLHALAPVVVAYEPPPDATPVYWTGDYDLTPYFVGRTDSADGSIMSLTFNFTPPPAWLDTVGFGVLHGGQSVSSEYVQADSASGIAPHALVWGRTNPDQLIVVAHPGDVLDVSNPAPAP